MPMTSSLHPTAATDLPSTPPRATATSFCRLCGAIDGREVLHAGGRALLACSGCSLVRLDPMPDAAELSAVYDSGAYYTTQPPHPRQGWPKRLQDRVLQAWWDYPGPARRGLRRVLGRVLTWPLRHRFLPVPFPGDAAVLDIGCGNGQRLLELQQHGCTALFGVEPTRAAAEQARRHTRAEIHAGLLEDAPLEDGKFALVILNQVLEHVPSPVDTLRRIHGLLGERGRLYLTVPNFASLEARLAGEHWDGLQIPVHLHHFSPASLRRTLELAGFDVELCRTDSVADVSRNTWRALRASGQRNWFARLPWRLLQLLGLVADACGRGQMLRVVARKRDG